MNALKPQCSEEEWPKKGETDETTQEQPTSLLLLKMGVLSIACIIIFSLVSVLLNNVKAKEAIYYHSSEPVIS